MKLRVQRKACDTCIFRKDCELDLQKLLNDAREKPPPNWPKHQVWEYFKGHRICHHSLNAVCAGFWARYKDRFQLGQLAQRLGLIEFVEDDTLSNKHAAKRAQRVARQQYACICSPMGKNVSCPRHGVGQQPLPFQAGSEKLLGFLKASRETMKGVARQVVDQEIQRRATPAPRFPPVELDEQEFLASLEVARAEGRTDLTVPQIERLLAMPYVYQWRE